MNMKVETVDVLLWFNQYTTNDLIHISIIDENISTISTIQCEKGTFL